MSGSKEKKGGKANRDDRLAERLRENLRKRKQQARSRASADAEKDSGGTDEDS